MNLPSKIKDAFRGQMSLPAAVLEIGRRGRAGLKGRYERLTRSFEKNSSGSAHLRAQFAGMSNAELLGHFRTRATPKFFDGFHLAPQVLADLHTEYFPAQKERAIKNARRIVDEHRWRLLGYGELTFGAEIDWLRDPVSGAQWPLDYHADLTLVRTDGDVRVLWELNRLGHLITLGQAFALSGKEEFAEEIFVQVERWNNQNPAGFGPNWSCAMEVALRAMNLLAAFHSVRAARCLSEGRLQMMLGLFERHGEYIRRHLEFSYIATSNHYLSDVVGLLWLGICLPELESAKEWQSFGLREMLREMDKQVLADGVHYEASTGYHRFVLELFLFSFILCQSNAIEIEDKYWQKLRLMLEYTHAYLRPDGHAPLIGDMDSGQVLPIVRRAANDHSYLLALGAVLLNEAKFKVGWEPPEELFWILGQDGVQAFASLDRVCPKSKGFADAGIYVQRKDDLYLLFNASRIGLKDRGAHGHNDALSVEVSACGTSFLSDPGTFVYTGDCAQRHLFRSTGYHSTVEIDGAEQNTIEVETPFRMADEARPRVLRWEKGKDRDIVVAEHYGYRKLPNGPITHRRTVSFDKRERYWVIEDTLSGTGTHQFKFIFHFAPDLRIEVAGKFAAEAFDRRTSAKLFIVPTNVEERPVFERRWFSRDYGAKVESVAACWTARAEAPLFARWLLLPVRADEDETVRLRLIEQIGNRQSTI
ncbi:MAG TPA: alginate lyase family protein [Pyrinomonadaceae bacterium]|nr:alginate lyase family protein [Pyrinomonadaceae bacterium]